MANETIHTKKENLDFVKANTPGLNIPVEANFGGEDVDFFQDPLPNNMPEPLEKPYGFFKNIWHGGIDQNTLGALYDYGQRSQFENNPIDDYVDPNWSSMAEYPNIKDEISPPWIHYVLSASGPKDLLRRKNYALDQMEENRRILNGSEAGKVLGGFTVGGAADPTSWLVMGNAFKYGKMSSTFLEGMATHLPGVALSAIARETILTTTKEDKKIADGLMDAFAETVLGTAFMGALPVVGQTIDAMKVYNAKGVIKMMAEGVEPRPVLNEKGVLTGWRAVPMDDGVGAAKVDKAQAYLDGAMAKNSLYAIPYYGETVGYAAGKVGQVLGGWISPQVRMSNSIFSTIRGAIGEAADVGFETEGVASGRAKADSFETMFGIYLHENRGLHDLVRGDYLAAIGIKSDLSTLRGRTSAYVKEKTASKDNESYMTEEEFYRKVYSVIINNQNDKNSSVNTAAERLMNAKDAPFKEYLSLHNKSEKEWRSGTAKRHLPRTYNAPFLDANEEGWIEKGAAELEAYDKQINTLMEPIKNAERQHKEAVDEHDNLIRRDGVSTEDIKSSRQKIDNLKRRVESLKDSLQDRIREDESLDVLVDDHSGVSASEAKQIISLKEPIKKINKEINAQEKVVDSLKKKSSSKVGASRKAKTPETADSNIKEHSELLAEIEIQEEKLRDLRYKLENAEIELSDKLWNNEIPRELYIENENTRFLKDENERLKLRDPYESSFHRKAHLKAQYDSIMNNTSEDIIGEIIDDMTPSKLPNSLKRRNVKLTDKYLLENNFLNPNPVIGVMNYRMAFGRRNAFKKYLDRLTVNGTPEEMITRFRKEYEAMKNNLREQYGEGTKKFEKKVAKLSKEYEINKNDLKNTLDKMQGKVRSSKRARAYTNMANLFAVSTKLGALPLTMSTDLMANVFKHGFWPFITDGLFPVLRTGFGLLNTEYSTLMKENAAHAHIADSYLALSMSQRNWLGRAQDYIPVQGRIQNGLENIAHFSMNFSGANTIQNLNEMTTAMIVQSSIMKSMKKYIAGNISDKELRDLLKYGIDPKIWANRFIEGWKSAGGDGNGFGGYIARYWEWADIEAANRMSNSIHRAVKDTIIRRGMFDAPFAMDDPLINSLMLFKGYVFASLNRYLVPLLQRPDANKIIGTLAMMAAGATQNPLRRLIAGKDPFEEEDHMFRNAMRDGGVFSILADGYEDLNFLTSNYFQDLVNNERYNGRLEMGVFNGPIGGIANDMTRIIGMSLSGEFNQQDMRRLAWNIPVAYSWQFRGLVNKMIENGIAPKTRGEARKMKEAGI